MTKKKNKIWAVALLILAFAIAMGGYYAYKIFYPNIRASKEKNVLYINTGSTLNDVVTSLKTNGFLIDETDFRFVASKMNYTNHVKPGKYLLKKKMSNHSLILLLRSGKQTPVDLVFNNVRTKEQLAEKISKQIEAPFDSINNLLNDANYLNQFGFTPDNVLAMIIPNTYQVYWNTSASSIFLRLNKEYKKFWNEERNTQARIIGFSALEISIIASIVQMESNKNDEKDEIAGVYINRLKQNMKLQADPTLIYALGDFTINRVLNVHKEIDSPYNTYMYPGLPPGTICLPTIASLNAVLNYTHHNYLYFCAKEDFSGYHAFAATYDKHLVNARRFQAALNRKGIKS